MARTKQRARPVKTVPEPRPRKSPSGPPPTWFPSALDCLHDGTLLMLLIQVGALSALDLLALACTSQWLYQWVRSNERARHMCALAFAHRVSGAFGGSTRRGRLLPASVSPLAHLRSASLHSWCWPNSSTEHTMILEPDRVPGFVIVCVEARVWRQCAADRVVDESRATATDGGWIHVLPEGHVVWDMLLWRDHVLLAHGRECVDDVIHVTALTRTDGASCGSLNFTARSALFVTSLSTKKRHTTLCVFRDCDLIVTLAGLSYVIGMRDTTLCGHGAALFDEASSKPVQALMPDALGCRSIGEPFLADACDLDDPEDAAEYGTPGGCRHVCYPTTPAPVAPFDPAVDWDPRLDRQLAGASACVAVSPRAESTFATHSSSLVWVDVWRVHRLTVHEGVVRGAPLAHLYSDTAASSSSSSSSSSTTTTNGDGVATPSKGDASPVSVVSWPIDLEGFANGYDETVEETFMDGSLYVTTCQHLVIVTMTANGSKCATSFQDIYDGRTGTLLNRTTDTLNWFMAPPVVADTVLLQCDAASGCVATRLDPLLHTQDPLETWAEDAHIWCWPLACEADDDVHGACADMVASPGSYVLVSVNFFRFRIVALNWYTGEALWSIRETTYDPRHDRGARMGFGGLGFAGVGCGAAVYALPEEGSIRTHLASCSTCSQAKQWCVTCGGLTCGQCAHQRCEHHTRVAVKERAASDMQYDVANVIVKAIGWPLNVTPTQ